MGVTTFPAGQPSASGTIVTVDTLLQQPRLVTRTINDLALQNFYVDKVFAPGGQVNGGAVLYEQATVNELYANRDVQRIEPTGAYPVIGFDDQPLHTAQVEKFGGKFAVSDEAAKRNRIGQVNKRMMQLANTIRRKTQQRAIAELDAAISANSRTATGVSWSAAAALTFSSKANSALPGADLAAAVAEAETRELGYSYDFAILNPAQWESLMVTYGGSKAEVKGMLEGYGITDYWVTNRQTAGKVKVLAQGMVGELAFEEPLSTNTYRDEDHDTTWVKSKVLPVVYVTDPFAILEIQGVA